MTNEAFLRIMYPSYHPHLLSFVYFQTHFHIYNAQDKNTIAHHDVVHLGKSLKYSNNFEEKLIAILNTIVCIYDKKKFKQILRLP